MQQKISIFWHRRDLRLQDNAGLYHALKGKHPVLCLFIFDTEILDKLQDKKDARVQFIHDSLHGLKSELRALGSDLLCKYGAPLEVWQSLIMEYDIAEVYCNQDYEPSSIARDEAVKTLLQSRGMSWKAYKDHLIFAENEITKDDGKPYTIFTPYSKKWLATMSAKALSVVAANGEKEQQSFYLASYPNLKYASNLLQMKVELAMPSLQDIGFEPHTAIAIPPKTVTQGLIRQYGEQRDFPALAGTSRLGIHFRFGTISIREKARQALSLSQVYLNELIWRDFYAMILFHFPHVVGQSFHKKYDNILWRNQEDEFAAWCLGNTGYPLVDAGMRELNATGFMHNRIRMLTASFLTKHLLIDWRWGEAYFAEKLLDYDLASNNGGWQWAAGCGTDAAPYFRIFSPEAQTKKFDASWVYIKKWVPEYGTKDYPKPIVDHAYARERCLATYKSGIDESLLG